MTPEQRLDRLERIAGLMAKAGLRARKQGREQSREQNEKINMIINAQIKNEEMFAKNQEVFAKNQEVFAENEKRFAENEKRVAQNEERFAKNEERFTRNEERFARNEERFVKHENRFVSEMRERDERFAGLVKFVMDKQVQNEERFGELAEAQIELAAAQLETNHRFDVLMDVIKEQRNGTSG